MSDDIMKKIAKLLRLSKSPHPAEAEAALAKAMELAARHGLDLAAAQAEAERPGVTERKTTMRRWSYEAKLARRIVQDHFGVTVVDAAKAEHCAIWVGVPENIAVAQHVFRFLPSACRRCMADASKRVRIRTANQRKSYAFAFFSGIGSVLRDSPIRNDVGYAAMITSDLAARERYLATMDGLITRNTSCRPDRLANAAAIAGFSDGLRTPVKRPLDAADIGTRAQLAGGGE